MYTRSNLPPGYVRDATPQDVERLGLETFVSSVGQTLTRVIVDEFEAARAQPAPRYGDWRPLYVGSRCRQLVPTGRKVPYPTRRGCGRPAVAEMGRMRGAREVRWWAYCEDHLFGRVWEPGPPPQLLAGAWISELRT